MPEQPQLPMPAGKECAGPCAAILPLTPDHWDVDASRADGFRRICKKCRALARELKKSQTLDKAIKKLDRATSRALSLAQNGGTDVPHMAETFEHLMRLLGGVQGFSRHVIANMMAAAPGSQTRERILNSILKLNMAVTEEGATVMPTDLTDADLERELERRQVKLGIFPGKPVDAPSEETP
jgi:hypothetical protein